MAGSGINTAVQAGSGLSVLTGALRDVYSAEIYFTALPVMKFDQFSTKKTELGVQPGRTINMPKMGGLKRGGRLTEGRKIRTNTMSMSSTSISVAENGNAVGFTEYLLQTSFYDQLAAASILLGRDLAIVLDLELRDTVLGASSVIYPNGKAARTQITSLDVLSTSVIKDAVVTLETNNSPRWGGDHYICFVHAKPAMSLRSDNDWINASLYSGVQQIYMGEIGRYESVRFIQSTVLPNGFNNAVDSATGDYVDLGFSNALRSGVSGNLCNIYQSVMFGEYAYGNATALPVELRDNGVTDYGREHGLAWYAIWGSGLLETNNIVVIETSGGARG
jgi:N4-gp56 family major capsid protein